MTSTLAADRAAVRFSLWRRVATTSTFCYIMERSPEGLPES